MEKEPLFPAIALAVFVLVCSLPTLVLSLAMEEARAAGKRYLDFGGMSLRLRGRPAHSSYCLLDLVTAALAALLVVAVVRNGYAWWFLGLATMMAMLSLWSLALPWVPREFRAGLLIYCAAYVPLTAGLVGGWLDYYDAIAFGVRAFTVLGCISIAGFCIGAVWSGWHWVRG